VHVGRSTFLCAPGPHGVDLDVCATCGKELLESTTTSTHTRTCQHRWPQSKPQQRCMQRHRQPAHKGKVSPHRCSSHPAELCQGGADRSRRSVGQRAMAQAGSTGRHKQAVQGVMRSQQCYGRSSQACSDVLWIAAPCNGDGHSHAASCTRQCRCC
jgi:hypothetical protein